MHLKERCSVIRIDYSRIVNEVSLWFKGGWSLGGVIPLHIFTFQLAEIKAGISICGLSPVDADFSILPPRFKVNATVNFADAVVGYETYSANFKIVIPYIIASVVHLWTIHYFLDKWTMPQI